MLRVRRLAPPLLLAKGWLQPTLIELPRRKERRLSERDERIAESIQTIVISVDGAEDKWDRG